MNAITVIPHTVRVQGRGSRAKGVKWPEITPRMVSTSPFRSTRLGGISRIAEYTYLHRRAFHEYDYNNRKMSYR